MLFWKRFAAVAACVVTVFLAACNKNETSPPSLKQPTSSSVPELASPIRHPTNVLQMFSSARYIAINMMPLSLEGGGLQRFNGTLASPTVRRAVLEDSDIKGNKYWGALCDSTFDANYNFGISTPIGRFIIFINENKDSSAACIVGINLETKKAAIMRTQYSNAEADGDVLTTAAIWVARGIKVVSRSPMGEPLAELRVDSTHGPMVVGYIRAVEAFASDAAKRQAFEQPQISHADTVVPLLSSNSLKFSGESLQYPRGVSEAAFEQAVPGLTCMTNRESGERTCAGQVSLSQRVLLKGLPDGGTCLMGKGLTVSFKKDALASLGCDIAPNLAAYLAEILGEKYGRPSVEPVKIGAMQAIYSEWKAGNDYLLITRFSGVDVNGNAINSFNIMANSSPSLPIQGK